MNGRAQATLAVLTLAIATAFSLAGWAHALSPDAALAATAALKAAVGGGLVAALALGVGLRIGQASDVEGRPPTGWSQAALWGGCACGGAGVLALGLGVPIGWGWAALAIPGAQGLLRVLRAELSGTTPPRGPLLPALVPALLLLGIGLPLALAPPTDTDALYQHLGLGHRMTAWGGWVGGPLHADASRPWLLIGLWAGAQQLFGAAAAGVLHLLIAAAVVGAVAQRAAREAGPVAGWLAPALLLPSWTVLHEAPIVGNNVPVAFAILVASELAAGGGRGLGLALGAALSFKYTAAGGVAAVLLGAPLGLRARLGALALALGCLAPWWLKNAAEGLHPLFPYAGWGGGPEQALTFQHLEKYGAGRDAAAMLRLPYTAIFTAEPHSFRFLGRLHPAMLAAALLAVVPAGAGARGGALGLLLALGMWAAGPQWLRHLIPILPLLCVQASVTAVRLARSVGPRAPAWFAGGLVALGTMGAPANLGPIAQELAETSALHRGEEAPDAYLRRRVPGAAAAQWINAHTENDAVVALLRSWDTALVDRRTLLGTVEDHVPLRHLLLRAEGQPLEALRAAGATHALVGPRAFTPRAYPFLSPAAYQRAFAAPERALEDALLMGATLLYASEGYGVYRLDAPRAAGAPDAGG